MVPYQTVAKRYNLSNAQRCLARVLGKKRCQAKPTSIRFNDSNFHEYNGDRAYPHILGACAEIAYSEVTNQELDLNLYKKGDLVDFNGIEVKSSTWPHSDIELKVKQKEYDRKKQNTLAYVLCRVEKNFQWVEFIGSISIERFNLIKKPKRHKSVDNWVVDAKNINRKLVFFENNKFNFLNIERETILSR